MSGIAYFALIVTLSVGIFTLGKSTPYIPRHENITDRVSRVLENMPVIDGHNDFPWTLKRLTFHDLRKVNFSSDLTQIEPWASDSMSHTDIPRLKKGRVGGQFWVASTECPSNYKDAVAQTLEQIDVIKRLIKEYPNDLHYAQSAADIEFAIANNKTASLIAVEGGQSIQSSYAILRLLYEMGARYMTLTWACNLPWADASPVDAGLLPVVNDGLSQFGLDVILEMNRLGIMVDLSHVSAATMRDAINISLAPVIFSHSSARAICNHHRNVPDDVLELVKNNGGIVMVNFYSTFIQCDPNKNATLEDVIEHIEHIKSVAGIDSLGIGADYDGVDSVPVELADVSTYPILFENLAQRGWSDDDMEKLAGRNLIRVFRNVEQVRDLLAAAPVKQDVITRADVDRAEITTDCLSWPFIDDELNSVKSTKVRA